MRVVVAPAFHHLAHTHSTMVGISYYSRPQKVQFLSENVAFTLQNAVFKGKFFKRKREGLKEKVNFLSLTNVHLKFALQIALFPFNFHLP